MRIWIDHANSRTCGLLEPIVSAARAQARRRLDSAWPRLDAVMSVGSRPGDFRLTWRGRTTATCRIRFPIVRVVGDHIPG
jgi:hypothetical protein